MSFEIIRKTGEIAFVANPIAFEVKTSGEAEIEIRLRVGAQEVFSASYVPFGDRIHFDIAEILQPFVTSGPLEDSEDLILPVSGFMAGYTLEVKGRETRTLTGKVICGGISKQAAREMAGRGTDFILNRLRDYSSQFLFTTRTRGKHIAIRETEVSPLIFIHPDKRIQVESEYGNRIKLPEGTAGEVYALNIGRIRREFFHRYNQIVSFIRVLVPAEEAFDISFTPGEVSENGLSFLFRNSLGCYEVIEMPGKMICSLDRGDDENYRTFDEEGGDYITGRPRPDLLQKMKLNTGFKRKTELKFIQDLLSSDDIRLLNGTARRRVLVTCEEYGYEEPMKEPTSLVRDIEVAERESNYTPDMDGENAPPFIELLPGEVEIPSEGGQVRVRVESNIMWEVV